MRLPSTIKTADHGFIRSFSTLLMHQALAFWTLSECVGTVGRWIGSKGIQMDASMASPNFSVGGGRIIRG